MKNAETAKRLILALERKGIKAQDLADQSNVSKVSISQYVNGTHAPSNVSAGKMAEVLGVSPVWLMGFDVPMYDTKEITAQQMILTDPEEQEIIHRYRTADDLDRAIVKRTLGMDERQKGDGQVVGSSVS